MNNVESIMNLSPEVTVIVICATLFIFGIVLIALGFRLAQAINANTQNNGLINQYLAAVPADRIATVNAIYQNTRKHLSTAMILAIVGGGLGMHRVYLGKRKSALAMFLFFWTGVPLVIAMFDLVAMPKTVSEYNLVVIRSLYDQLTE